MNMSATYESDMKYCEEAIRHGSLSFHAASLLLPKAVRDPCLALYAFCRLADDEVDLKTDKSASVKDLVQRLDQVYMGTPRNRPWTVHLPTWSRNSKCHALCPRH